MGYRDAARVKDPWAGRNRSKGNLALVLALATGSVWMPGKGMSFILYAVVLVVSITSVMIGLDWLSTPPPPIPKSVQTVRAPARPVAPPVVKSTKSAKESAKEVATAKTESAKSAPEQATAAAATTGAASPTTGTKVDVVKQPDVATAAPETAGSAPAGVIDNSQTNASDGTLSIITNEGDVSGAAAQANAPVPRCDVQACTARYHTFTASDCTYQPFDGPRRLCTVGNPPNQANAAPAGVQTSAAGQKPASPSCNVQSCADAYRSFDPATCTWQPFDGPRRLCEK